MFFKYLFIFSIFSIVGWFLELGYRSTTNKRFINPGFMSGPVVPLYGIGAVILNIICDLFSFNESGFKVIIIFILSTIILSCLEYFTGYILFKIFNLKLWDYKDKILNINGFICLEFSLIWGLLSLIYYTFIYNKINDFLLNNIDNINYIFFLGIFVGIFLIDLCVSIDLINKLRKHAKEIEETINIEKLKIDLRLESKRKKFINSIYPFVSLKRYLRDKNNKK